MLLAADQNAGWFLENAWLIPLIPSIAFFLILIVGKRLPRGGSELGIGSMVAALVIAAGATYQWIDRVNSSHGEEVEPVIRDILWWRSGPFEFRLGEHIDGLAIALLLLVAFISTLVQIYSTEYVAGDRRYTHFFAAMTLFSAGMLAMVLAPNMVQLILGWEIMGLCSFMLIGHWWEEEANSRAALKAFFTVRVGDMGLLVGTAMLLGVFGTLDIAAINEAAAEGHFDSKNMLMWTAVALFIACIGKSGQFPLHTWLPDAMAGPTPVSSLLHSSTMVVAGVFLVARLYPVFHVGLEVLIPSHDIQVTRDQHDKHEHEDLYVAIRDAFDALERRIKAVAHKASFERFQTRIHRQLPLLTIFFRILTHFKCRNKAFLSGLRIIERHAQLLQRFLLDAGYVRA